MCPHSQSLAALAVGAAAALLLAVLGSTGKPICAMSPPRAPDHTAGPGATYVVGSEWLYRFHCTPGVVSVYAPGKDTPAGSASVPGEVTVICAQEMYHCCWDGLGGSIGAKGGAYGAAERVLVVEGVGLVQRVDLGCRTE